jgi:hypothetical protein
MLRERRDTLVVTGLGGTTWDAASLGEHENDFYLWGGMGGAAMVGLGLALARPDRRVLVITGDGEMLMGLGSLATIGVSAPPNLAVAVVDNQLYGETGRQPSHTALGVDLAGIARASGITSHVVEDLDALEEIVPLLHGGEGPVFVNVRVSAESGPMVLPEKDGVKLKERFRTHTIGGDVTDSPAPTPKTREILERLSEDRAALLASVAGRPREQMEFRPTEDSWSIGDVLHHLALSHEATTKLMSNMLRRAREETVPPDLDPTRSVLSSIDDIVPRVDQGKAPAPDRVTPRSYVPPGEALTRLDASRRRLEETVAVLSEFDLTNLTFPHPFFGELDCYQWLLVTGWHERRHTKQIERIQKSRGFPR